MIDKELIAKTVNECLEGTDLFLVEVKVKPGNIIEVFVDADSSVNIDQCVEISRHIESRMDRDAEDFELSVYSYGLSGALKLPRQFAKYLEKDVEVKTKEQGKIQGKLLKYDGQQIEIAPTPTKKPSKRKPAAEGNLTFNLGEVSVYPAIVF